MFTPVTRSSSHTPPPWLKHAQELLTLSIFNDNDLFIFSLKWFFPSEIDNNYTSLHFLHLSDEQYLCLLIICICLCELFLNAFVQDYIIVVLFTCI